MVFDFDVGTDTLSLAVEVKTKWQECMDAAKNKSRYQVPNLERALTIMEHLAAKPDCSTMAEIARALKYPNNSVFRIVSSLEERGYLIKDIDSNNYRLSRKLLSLGYQALVETGLTEKSLDILRSLRDATGETALIGTLLEGEGVVLDLVLSLEPIKFMVSPGTRFSLYTAAPGKAMLAFLEEAERERQIGLIKFTRFNDRTIAGPDELREALRTVRRQGFGVDCGEEAAGIFCVGAPVFDYRGWPVAAIWITGPEFRLAGRELAQIGDIVATHARELSQRLGHQG